MAEKPSNRRPSWRNQGTPPAPAAGGSASPAPAAQGKRDWQRRGGQEPLPGAPLSRSAKFTIAVAALLVVLTSLVLVASWLKPRRPACLVLLGASYDANLSLPHNAFGYQALLDLEKIADRTSPVSTWWWHATAGDLRLEHRKELKTDEAHDRLDVQRLWNEDWGKLRDDFREQTLVLVLALHGHADADGKPYFHIDSRTGQRRTLPLEDVLKSLAEERFKEKKVVLVLEPAQVGAHWPTGMLQNDFVRALTDRRLKERLEAQPNLLVLCASDVGQVSWASEEWRRTIFGHYLIEGLRGAADGAGGRPQNQEVDAWELFSYVQDKVKAWSLQNRGVEQTPILLGGERRAAETKLVLVPEPVKETPAEEAPGLNFRADRGRADAIQAMAEEAKWQALRRLGTHPAVYSPQLWRHYLEAQVRSEQLLRAGYSEEKLAEVRRALKLDRAADEIRQQAEFEQANACLGAALPMPAVLGLQLDLAAKSPDRPEPGDAFYAKVKALLPVKDKDERQRALAELQEQAKALDAQRHQDLAGRLWRASLYRALIEHLGQTLDPADPEGDAWPRALLALLQKDRYRPAEAHFLAMLLRHLDPANRPDKELLRGALKTRLAAEEAALAAPARLAAHPYSEVLQPWVRARVEKADEQRRRGEDRLFSSHAEDHALAAKDLAEALQQYSKVLADAAVVRAALDARDRALAELPFLAQWVALQRPSRLKEREDEVEGWLAAVEGLALEAKLLQEALGRALKDALGVKELPELRDATARVREKHQALKANLANDSRKLAEDLQHLQHRLHEAEAILAVPLLLDSTETFDAVANRRDILVNLRKLTAALHRKGQNNVFEHLLQENELGRGAAGAARQGRMAVAALRPLRPLAPGGPALRQALEECASQSDQEYADAEGALDLRAAQAKLAQAEYRLRFVPAGAVPFLKNTPWPAPEALRRLRVHDLLLAQAERTLRDHWYAEDGTSYYEPVAKEYARAAEALVTAGVPDRDRQKARGEAAFKLRQAIRKSGVQPHPVDAALKHLDDGVLVCAGEKEVPLRWLVEPDDDRYLDPLGVAVARLELRDAEVLGGALSTERFNPVVNYKEPLRVNIRSTLKAGDKKKGRAELVTFYRGQLSRAVLGVAFEQPDLIVDRFAPPKEAGLTVQLDKDFTYGAISIVLDCSGSMLQRVEGKERFEHALDALEAVLTRIPRNTELSLITFVDLKAGRAGQAPDFEFRVVRSPSSWDAESQLERLLRKVKDLRGEIKNGVLSPIASTLVFARDRGFAAFNRGPKLILALTDGDDNYSGHLNSRTRLRQGVNQQEYNKDISDYLEEEFRKRQIAIHMVCFNPGGNKAAEDEAANARKQFGGLQDTNVFNPPGSFKTQPDAARLGEDLERVIRPRLVLQEAPPPLSTGGIYASYPDDQAVTPTAVPPGEYKPWMPGALHERPFLFRRGDILPVRVWRDREDHHIGFGLGLLGAGSPHQATQGQNRQLSVLEHDRDRRSHQLNQLLALENPSAASRAAGGPLQQVRPGFIWLETKPVGGRAAGPARWYQQYGYAALTYRVEVQRWPSRADDALVPAPTSAETRVWWSDEPDEPRLSQTFDVKRGEAFSPPTFHLQGSKVIVEEAVFDVPQRVWTGPAKQEERKCLLLRLHHPDPAKLFFVQLDNPQAHPEHASEHQYYTQAGSATVLFWDLAERDAYKLRVIAVDAVKQAAPLRVGLESPFENRAQSLGHIFRE